MELVECQDVGVGFNFFSSFSDANFSFVCDPLFFPGLSISPSVANANSLALVTPLEVLSFLGGLALHLVVWKSLIFNMFSACLLLSTLSRKLLFLVFLTFFSVALVEITFSMRKGENLVRQTSTKDSITMNLEKSDANRFCLIFYLKMS